MVTILFKFPMPFDQYVADWPVTITANPLSGCSGSMYRVVLATDGTNPRPRVLPVMYAAPPALAPAPAPHSAPPPLPPLTPTRTQAGAVRGRRGGRGGEASLSVLPSYLYLYLETIILIVHHIGIFGRRHHDPSVACNKAGWQMMNALNQLYLPWRFFPESDFRLIDLRLPVQANNSPSRNVNISDQWQNWLCGWKGHQCHDVSKLAEM